MCVVERGMIFLACTIDYFTKCSQLLNKALFCLHAIVFFYNYLHIYIGGSGVSKGS